MGETTMQTAAEREQLGGFARGIDAVGEQHYPESALRLDHETGACEAGVTKACIRHAVAEEAQRRTGYPEAQSPVLILTGSVIAYCHEHGLAL